MSHWMVLSNWNKEAQSWEWFELNITKATPEKPGDGPDQPITRLLLYLARLQQEGLRSSLRGQAPGFYSAELTQ